MARITAADYLLTPAIEDLQGFTLPDLFVKTATRDAAKVAVKDGEQVWTWSQWQNDADALARALQDDGIGPGDVVAIQLVNSWEFLTLYVALALLGAVVLPLHVASSRSDVEAVLSRTQPAKVVDAAGWERLYAAGSGGSPRPVNVTSAMPLVLLPSSGTTSAQPKICLHSHGSLMTNAANIGGLTGRDVALTGSPYSHMFGLHLLHQCLQTGPRADASVGRQRILAAGRKGKGEHSVRGANPVARSGFPAWRASVEWHQGGLDGRRRSTLRTCQ